MPPRRPSGPLAGRRIVDFTWAWAGPYGAMLLALLGADVIKIESRTRLDQARVGSLALGRFKGTVDQQPMFNELNLGKRSLTLNFKGPGATDVVRDLLAVSDAAIDNFRPGTLDKLGLGYDAMRALRPDAILVSSSALGATGPERDYGGYAPTFAALAGLVAVSGHPNADPILMGGTIDLRVGTAAALALLVALHHRDRTGRGAFVDASARDAVAILIGEHFLGAQFAAQLNGPQQAPLGNGHSSYAPHGIYPCRNDPDGHERWLALACRTDAEWEAFCRASGLSALTIDARFATGLGRWKSRQALDQAIGDWTRLLDPEDAAQRLLAAGVPASASRTPHQLYDSDHFHARGGPVPIAPPTWDPRRVVPPPWRFSVTPASIPGPAPLLGADNHAVLRDLLHYDDARIAQLEESGALE